MSLHGDVLTAVNNILDALPTKPELGTWGEPDDHSVLVRQTQPDGTGNSQYMVETIAIAASGILARIGTDDISSLSLTDIVSRSDDTPGSPIIGAI